MSPLIMLGSCRSWHPSSTSSWLTSAARSSSVPKRHFINQMFPDGLEQAAPDPNETSKFVPFRTMIDERRRQAKQSLMIQVKSKYSAEDLFTYCTKNIGKIKGMHFHVNPNTSVFSDFYLVEFESSDCVKTALEHGLHQLGSPKAANAIPVSSPFLWFSGSGKPQTQANSIAMYLPVHLYEPVGQEDLGNQVIRSGSLHDQIMTLYNLTQMSDLSYRLRFMACQQIELALSGMFPQAEVLPFGSSVNSYGKGGSDLDMIVNLKGNPEPSHKSRLVFHVKSHASRDASRIHIQRRCEQLSSIIQVFLPGCKNVQNILHAKVPIIKFNHQILGLDCDVSMSSQSGFYMSELLYIYGELDERVRPLVSVIRKWAKVHGLIEDTRPTHYFTNFGFTLLTLFFLQHKVKMLPPLKTLIKMAETKDHVICDDGIECTFRRDLRGFKGQLNKCFNQPEPSVSQLLLDFFDFYSTFDFNNHGLCLLSGQRQRRRIRTNHQVTYNLDLVNPLESDQNVCYNVRPHAVAMFVKQCQKSHQVMQDMMADSEPNLLRIFGNGHPQKLVVSVPDLNMFDEEEPESEPELNGPTELDKAFEEAQKMARVKDSKRGKKV